MKKKFITNLAFLVLLNLLVKLFYTFRIDLFIQNTVGTEEYGLYFPLFNLSMILNIILDIGLTNYNNRNVAQNSHLIAKYFSNIVTLKFILAVVYAVVIVIIGLVAYNVREFQYLLLLAFNQFLLSFILYLRSNIAGLHFFKTDSIISVLDRALLIIICSILLWTNIFKGEFHIAWFIIAQTVSYGLTALVAFFVVLKKAGFPKIKYDRIFIIMTLRQCYPYAVLVLLMAFYNRFDSVMLSKMLPDGNSQAGIYAQSFRLLDAVVQFAFLFSTLLLPIFARMIKQKQAVNQMVKLASSLLMVPVFILAITVSLFSHDIIGILYHEHVDVSSKVFSILILGFIPIAITYIFGTLLTANGNLKELNIMAASGMMLNIILNFVLIPRFQAKGSAIASLVTQSLTAVVQTIIAIRIFDFSLNRKFLGQFISFVAFTVAIGVTMHCVNINWLIGAIITISLSGLFAVAIRLLHLKDMLIILKEKESEE